MSKESCDILRDADDHGDASEDIEPSPIVWENEEKDDSGYSEEEKDGCDEFRMTIHNFKRVLMDIYIMCIRIRSLTS